MLSLLFGERMVGWHNNTAKGNQKIVFNLPLDFFCYKTQKKLPLHIRY